MRVLLVPLVAFGTMVGGSGDEPSTRQMRAAFADSLHQWVTNATEFVALSGGPEALADVRRNHTEWFSIRAFEKFDCLRTDEGYACSFRVDVDVVNETLQYVLTGRFRVTDDGMVYEPQDQEV